MDAEILKDDISNVNNIPKASTTDTLKAAYALQNMVDKNYVRTGTVTSENAWTTTSTSTPGKNSFFELEYAQDSAGNQLPVEAADWTGIQLYGTQLVYSNLANSDDERYPDGGVLVKC